MDRRDFIKMLGLAGTSAAAYTACSAYMQEALAQSTVIDDLLAASAHCQLGSLKDIDHVIFLMKENRSFDHYFGTLRGVRGFGDPRPLRLRNGNPVFTQPRTGKTPIKPFQVRRASGSAGDFAINDHKLAHAFEDGLAALGAGWNDNWFAAKKSNAITMAHLDTAADIPYYSKLAMAFTICDGYHCSIHAGTHPNRAHFWTGTAGGATVNDHLTNAAKFKRPDWTTYAACSAYMQQALAQSANTIDELLTEDHLHCKGKLADIEHVVILMQENRSFDHYFGTLRGVRGFGDPRPLRLKNGKPVWEQSGGARPYRLPKKPANESGIEGETNAADSAGSVFLDDPAHGYPDGIAAWNGGRMDGWKEAKGFVSFAHYTKQDIPLYFQLAEKFTLCDAYFCSHNGATDPNRSFFFTGTCMGRTSNGYFSGAKNPAWVDWKSYPEKLEDLGIDWKFYQDGLTWTGDAFAGNYGDNTLEYFKQYRDKTTSIYKKNQSVNSVLRTDASKPSQFEQDIIDGKLPEVSWIVAPEAFTEHPKYPPHFGEYYIHEILRAFAANKKVWHKTLFLINFDENGGFFDHVLPPAAPLNSNEGLTSPGIALTAAGTINSETSIQQTDAIGMGVRVPMLVISPWSTGGRVNSEVFDHTSVNRFIDKWLIARGKQAKDTQPFQVSSWRQAISGDLTSTLDFNRLQTDELDILASPTTRATILTAGNRSTARGTAAFKPGLADVKADADAGKPIMVKQDKTRCEILPVAYDFQVYFRYGTHSDGKKRVEWVIRNTGPLGTSFYVIPYSRNDKPWRYSVEGVKAGGTAIELTDFAQIGNGVYEYVIHGPNGYLFEFSGNTLDALQMQLPDIIDIKSADEGKKLQFVLGKWQTASSKLKLIDAYSGAEQLVDQAREDKNAGTTTVEIATKDGWYDVAVVDAANANNFLRRYAGHLENGRISKSDPAIGLEYDSKKRVYAPVMA